MSGETEPVPARLTGGGQTQAELLAWLRKTWLPSGPCVCVVEGFSGLGKTYLGDKLRGSFQGDSTLVEISEPQTRYDDLLLLAAGSLAADTDVSIPLGSDIAAGLRQALNSRLLMVVDNFEHCLDDGGNADPAFMRLVRRLCSGPLPGRVLLLTCRMVDQEEWLEQGAVIRRLGSLPAPEGGLLLQRMLKERDREDEITEQQAPELAGWLGCNPRAMQALVSALEFAPIEELVGEEPELVEADYRFVGQSLVDRLERRFLSRTMDSLSPETLAILHKLAVHRRSFKREAIELVHTGPAGTLDGNIGELVKRFVLQRRLHWYDLNPTVRELALQAVRREPGTLLRAHQRAADYYVRPFKAKRVVAGANTPFFLEARHHLLLSNRAAELREVAANYALHTQRSILAAASIPDDPAQLDGQILLLQAALAGGSPDARLNLRLAEMLLKRGRPHDREAALSEAAEAVRFISAPKKAWLLYLELLAEAKGIDAAEADLAKRDAEAVGEQSRHRWVALSELAASVGQPRHVAASLERALGERPPPERKRLYLRTAQLLVPAGMEAEALELLARGIADCREAGLSVSALYEAAISLHIRCGDLDAAQSLLTDCRQTAEHKPFSLYWTGIHLHRRRGDHDAAVELLNEGLREIAPSQSLHALYTAGIDLYQRHGDNDAAVNLLNEGLRKIAPSQSLNALYIAGIELHSQRGDYDAAVELLKEGLGKIAPSQSLHALYTAGIDLYRQHGDYDAAVDLLNDGLRKIAPSQSLHALYTAGIDLYQRRGDYDAAVKLLNEGLRVIAPTQSLFALCSAGIELHSRRGDHEATVKLGIDALRQLDSAEMRQTLLYALHALVSLGQQVEMARQCWDALDAQARSPQTELSAVLRLSAEQKWHDAWLAAAAARQDRDLHVPILCHEIFCALADDQPQTAAAAADLVDFEQIQMAPLRVRPTAWLLSIVYDAVGRRDEAWELLAEYWNVPRGEQSPTAACIKLWQQTTSESVATPKHYHPVLPPAILRLGEPGAQPAATSPRRQPLVGASQRVELESVRGKVDFGILSIKEEEFVAVLDCFQPDRFADGNQIYELGSVNAGPEGSYTFAAVRCPNQGQGYAQRVATHLIQDLAPRWLLLVGIAGAVPSPDFTLGDVVCASRVHDFTVRAVQEGREDAFNVGGGPVHPEVERVLASLPAICRRLAPWNSDGAVGRPKPALSVPGLDSDRYYGDDAWKASVYATLAKHFPSGVAPRPPLATARSVVSSDALVKSTHLVAQWQQSARAVAAIEMELGGVFLAARQVDREVPVLAIRGISDIVGFKRDEDWTQYACLTAASFAHALVTSGALLRPRTPA